MAGSGGAHEAQAALDRLAASSDHTLRSAVARRQRVPLADPREILNEPSRRLLDRIERAQDQENRFTGTRSPFSRRSVATVILVAANVMVFLLEVQGGGSENIGTLQRLGALAYPAVKEGQWWRLLTSTFLHFGPLHLGMNLMALLWLGPFVEVALGFRRFFAVYLFSGVAASAAALVKMAVFTPDQPMVGASGCIMGLVGATAAVSFRGWRREKARIAGRQLLFLGTVIAAQTVFDVLTPEVSMIAHLTGTVSGAILASFFKHRL